MDNYVIELRRIVKRFGSTAAVDQVSLDVKAGEFITLLGPSGCGKTTLLRMIAGLETPDEGAVLLNGADVTGLPAYKRDVSTVFQQYALFPHLDVKANVAFGLKRRRVARSEIEQRVSKAIDMVRLNGLDHRKPSELSGGQQQRVALARSLVLNPRSLLLDEPLAALDLKLRKQMQIELKALQRRLGISFIYVTHDQEEALTMSDRIAVMNAGKIEQIGTAEEIYERPLTEFTASFIGESNVLDGTLESSSGDTALVRINDTTARACLAESVRGVPVGSTIRLMIRPEKITLGSSNGINGTIEAQTYLGESTRLRIRLKGGQELSALGQNSGRSSRAAGIGDEVTISWEPECAVVLPPVAGGSGAERSISEAYSS